MSDLTRKCFRCAGKGYAYKIGGGYTNSDLCGGKKEPCPLCAGAGLIESKESLKKSIKKNKKTTSEKK